MPFASFKDFAACVVHQKDKGHSNESAHRICGYLKNTLEKKTIMQEDNKKHNVIKQAEDVIQKARMVVKPTNPEKYVVGTVRATGTATLDPRKAGKLNDVRGLKKDEKTTAVNDPQTSVTKTDVAVIATCPTCGNTSTPKAAVEPDNAPGLILRGSDDLPNVTSDDIAVQKFAVRLQKSAQADEEHYVLGVVLEPETLDSQGDIYSASEIRKSAHLFMQNFANIGLQHDGHINEKAKILESYIAPTDFTLNDQVIKCGTWLLGARILDEDLWQAIKKGEITGWSIGGSAIRTPLEATN